LKEDETLRVSSGSLVAITSDVDFDVTTNSGFKNMLFGGEGLFVTKLTGPGKVWLQGMPVDRMVSEIVRRVPSGGGIGLGIPIMGGGGVAGLKLLLMLTVVVKLQIQGFRLQMLQLMLIGTRQLLHPAWRCCIRWFDSSRRYGRYKLPR
jgi:hypothetical protein